MGLCRWLIWLSIYLLTNSDNIFIECSRYGLGVYKPNQYNTDVTPGLNEGLKPVTEYKYIILDIKSKKSNRFFTYKKNYITGLEKFTCNHGFLISKIVKNNKFVIEPPKNKYFDRVVIFRDEHGDRNLRCLFSGYIDELDPDESFPDKHMPLPSLAKEPEAFKFKHKLITVDIKNTKNTLEVHYEYNSQNQSQTFTSKPGYLIEKVTRRDVVLWNANDHGQGYGFQVYVGKDEKGEPIFRVHFHKEKVGPKVINYKKEPEFKPKVVENKSNLLYVEPEIIDSRIEHKAKHKVIGSIPKTPRVEHKVVRFEQPKVESKVLNSKSESFEIVLDVLKFKNKEFDPEKSPERAIYNVNKLFHDVDYFFRPNVMCYMVTKGDIVIWKKGEKDVEFPTSVSYSTDLNQVVIRNREKGIIFQINRDNASFIASTYYDNTKHKDDVIETTPNKLTSSPTLMTPIVQDRFVDLNPDSCVDKEANNILLSCKI